MKIQNTTQSSKRIRLTALDSAMSNIDDSVGAVAKVGRDILLCLAPKGAEEQPSDKANEMHFTTLAGTIDYSGVAGDQIIFSDGTSITLVEEYLYDIAAPAGKHKVVLKEPREATYVGIGGEALIELHNFPTLSSVDSFNFYPNNASTNLVKVPTVLPPNIVYTVRMFSKASSFNQDISMWDTSNVKYMYYMFSDATSFNQPLNSWDTSNVLDMSYMFRSATDFNQPIGNWNTSNVAYMQHMFRLATSFAQDLSQWCVPTISSKPISFDENAPLFTTDKHPVWGTCPVPGSISNEITGTTMMVEPFSYSSTIDVKINGVTYPNVPIREFSQFMSKFGVEAITVADLPE